MLSPSSGSRSLAGARGPDLTVLTPRAVSGILNTKGELWLSDNRLLRYQSLLLEGPVVQI